MPRSCRHDRRPPVPAEQIDALRRGDLAGAFGPHFAHLPLREPVRLPDGRLRLVDRVTHLEPAGGRYGIGLIRSEADIHPDDWFLTCHFVDDQVMPGTLMYECCLHTLRIFLFRLGWVGERSEVVFEPVPGVASQLKCRGQVTARTRTVTYEVTLKERGYRPQPFAIGDALMYADGKPIVEIRNMSLQLTGLTQERLQGLWEGEAPAEPGGAGSAGASPSHSGPNRPVLFGPEKILAFSNGKPSEAFGEPYRVFDSERVIARLPGPPYQFMNRIVQVDAQPWQMVAGGSVEAEYDVPADVWYFAAARSQVMPFAVLLEIALQPCGWLAAYIGSALSSPIDLSFRNLGGSAELFSAPLSPRGRGVPNEGAELFTVLPPSPGTPGEGSGVRAKDNNPHRAFWGLAPRPSPPTPLPEYRERGENKLFAPIGSDIGTLTTRARITGVAQSAGMIIQNYDFEVRAAAGVVYRGKTVFGFFSKAALAQQVGIRDAQLYEPTAAERRLGRSFDYPQEPPYPDARLRMIDRIDLYLPAGGPAGLGLILGSKQVRPDDWFFQAHFYQDPVIPGSLGLESLLQLLAVHARERWPGTGDAFVQMRGGPHHWVYRGQVLPSNREVQVQAVITACDDRRRQLTADGWLLVDGRIIYQMKDFTLALDDNVT